MKRKRSLEEKLEAIGLVVQGESAHSVSERFHLGHHVLYEWLEVYRNEGIAGLKARHAGVRKPLSYGKKCQIIQEYREIVVYLQPEPIKQKSYGSNDNNQ